MTTTLEPTLVTEEELEDQFEARPRRHRRWRHRVQRVRRHRILRIVAPILAGVVAAFIAMTFVTTKGRVGPATVTLHVRPDWSGNTVVDLPPFGHLTVDSHRGPIQAKATVEEINVDAVQSLVASNDPTRELQTTAESDLMHLIRRSLVHLGVAVVLAGAVAGAVTSARRRRGVVLGIAGAVVSTACVLALVWSTYDVDALRHPRYEGALSRAPALVAAVEREYGNLAGVRDRAKVLAGQIAELSRAATTATAAGNPAEVRILHVSDVHLNPLGVEIARDLASTFKVAAVIDTGDLTSFGLPGEANIGSMLESFPVPYYFVPGNHDSPANRREIASHRNVTVLNGTTVDIDGVKILGYGDPAFTAFGGTSYAIAKTMRERAAPEVGRLVAADHPDVLAVAGGGLAEASLGEVPLVIYGDIHRRTENVENGTRVLTVGSTGATGLGSFTRSDNRPYEAQVLRFVDGKLVGLDYVTVHGVSGDFNVDRVVYDDSSR